jgi:hypothetical protein
MPAAKPTKITLNGKPSAVPQLTSFSGLNQHETFLRAKTKQTGAKPKMKVMAAAIAPVADADTPAADSSPIPGVAISTAVQGFVAGMAVSTFADGLDINIRTAVLNAITYCSLAANGDIKKNPALNYIAQWAAYLPSCAFNVKTSGSGGYEAKGEKVSLDAAILDCLAGLSLDISAIGIIKEVVTALKMLSSNQGALTLFSRNTIKNGHVRVGTTSVSKTGDGNISLTVTFYELAFSSNETRVLWVTVNNTDSQMSYTTLTAELNQGMLPTLEPLLIARLQDLYENNIANVDLENS